MRHRQLAERRRLQQELLENSDPTTSHPEAKIVEEVSSDEDEEVASCRPAEENAQAHFQQKLRERNMQKARERLESTSLMKTPIDDEDLKDFHEHKLLNGQDPFDLKYQLYAVVVSTQCTQIVLTITRVSFNRQSHSGLLNGGHYISYACNPNGNWYCYNDSSCREMSAELPAIEPDGGNAEERATANSVSRVSSERTLQCSTGCTPLSRRKNAEDDSNLGE